MVRTLIYIAAADSAVFESQVLSLLDTINAKKYFDRIVLLAGVKRSIQENQILDKCSEYKIEVILFHQFPNYSFYNSWQKKELAIHLKEIVSTDSIIHIRGIFLTGLVRKIIFSKRLSNINIITDIRGDAGAEMEIYLRKIYNPLKYYLKKRHYKKCLRNLGKGNEFVSCVSSTLLERILLQTPLIHKSAAINHSIAGSGFVFLPEQRKKIRKELGVENDEILCVFVTGGDGFYENSRHIVSNISEKGFKVLNLSRKKYSFENVINAFVPYKKVPHYLSAADLAIIWRNNDLVNNVASPVKFSEYVCCGLPVIANNGVILIKEYIQKTGFGKIITAMEDISSAGIKDLLLLNRGMISNIGRKTFSADTIADNYIKIYKDLLSDN